MEKLILIDGNSLMNRAFYAMNVFTTKEGFPTNGIFGFVKLIFKIIEEEHPAYIAVAFDVHAPTFRHKMYEAYKGTRKPTPEDLVKQFPVLKELLQAMKIRMVEKEGYEADDLIGTLSRAFPNVETLIYTGDRDAYQLVKEHVSVCFTKRGVSDLDRMTAINFVQKEGITPAQIIELKALMGDSSDNIPGVPGIGPKMAQELLKQYGTVDNIYAHLGELREGVAQKLEKGRESAFLSRTLATIDTAVPLDVTLESCALKLPFPEEARSIFASLEFRTMVDGDYFPKERKSHTEVVRCVDLAQFEKEFAAAEQFVFCRANDCHVYCNDKEYIFPIKDNFLTDGFFEDELTALYRILFGSKKKAVLADVKAEVHKLEELGIVVNTPMEDVGLLRYMCDSNQRPVGAREIAKDYAMPEENCAYAVYRAYTEAKKRISETDEKLYRDLECPLLNVLLDMERTGVRVDESKFQEFSDRYRKELDAVSMRIFELAGERFNLNSPFKLSDILFEKLKLPHDGFKKNQRGGYSTEAVSLEKLEGYEIVRQILRYREIQKLQSTYIDGIRPLVENGIVHTTYNQSMTTTGRLSSANPNLQNIPVRKEEGRELRKLFIAREGNVLLDADYSQIELRLLAHFSGCRLLLDAYNSGLDIHAQTASQVFGVPLDKMTPEIRRRAKAINFGIIYGISAYGLSKDVGCSQQEAQDYITRYFETYREVREFMDENVARAKRDGYVETILGRKRMIPEVNSTNYNQRMFGERAAMNMPLQGSSADIIKIAMLNVAERLNQEGLRAKLVLQVHDELVLDAPLEEVEPASKLLKEEMERAVTLRVPLIAEVSQGKSWYEAK